METRTDIANGSEAEAVRRLPKRNFLDTPGIVWRNGAAPDYSLVDDLVLTQRLSQHKPGSLGEVAENLVKTWEMEATHKTDYKQWESVDYEHYELVVNGQTRFDVHEAARLGTYNMLLHDSPLYDAKSASFEESHDLFMTAFKNGFPWELLEILSGPPKVTFTWRHWARWAGAFGDEQPTGELIELFGVCIATVTEDLKIQKLEIFTDPNPMLQKLSKICPLAHKT